MTTYHQDRPLSGWAEIADFLRVTEKTAMKYYRENGLPVFTALGRVYANKSDIQDWIGRGVYGFHKNKNNTSL